MKKYTNSEKTTEVAEPQVAYNDVLEESLTYNGLTVEELRRIDKSKAQVRLGMLIDDDEVERIISEKYHYENQMV